MPLTNHGVIEVRATSLEHEDRLRRVLREAGGKNETSSPTTDDDIVKGLARDLIDGRKEAAHGCSMEAGRCAQKRGWAMGQSTYHAPYVLGASAEAQNSARGRRSR